MFRMFKKSRGGTHGAALVIFPDQLFKIEDLPDVDQIYLIEDPLYFGNDKHFPYSPHGAKLLFLRSSMQRYLDEVLWPANKQVEYIENTDDLWSGTGVAQAALDGHKIIYVFEPNDHRLKGRLIKAESELTGDYKVEWLSPPNFYFKPQEAVEFFEHKKTDFQSFYQLQRERFNILLGKKYKPVGGAWMLEPASSSMPPKPNGIQSFGDNKYIKEAYKYVEHKFDHFHDLPESFIWPTNSQEAMQWIGGFSNSTVIGFSFNSKKIDLDSAWSNRSLLGMLLNSGLLYPQEVTSVLLKAHSKKPKELVDIELFVRQLSWREYLRAFYLVRGLDMSEANYFDATRGLGSSWAHGRTGIEPIDKLINKARNNAYLSSQERIVLGTLMLLIGVSPKNVASWFNDMMIDSNEWAITTNVFAASQYALGANSLLASPPIFNSVRLVEMGMPEDLAWQEVWDGLYHRFVDMHRAKLPKEVVKAHDELSEDIKRVLGYRAGDFLAEHTRR